MLNLLRGRRQIGSGAGVFAPPEAGGPTYAIGDVHGRHDLLGRLLERLIEDCARRGVYPKLVLLGDYIDRGEHSRGTIGLLMELARIEEIETVFLMGNHEHMLLRFVGDPSTGSQWLKHGGLQTLHSYGIGSLPGDLRDRREGGRLRDRLVAALGPHLGFIEGLAMSHRAGNVLFTHAGADPALPPEQQDPATLLWGSERFREAERSDGVWVVHGHYVVEQPSAACGRIAVDTGAYYSGRLTAARIEGGEVSFVSS